MIETLIPHFVQRFPDKLVNGELYIAMEYGTAAHNCCCGCGRKVVTPFGPTDWKLIYDGDAISLHPSIGNWSFPCQSHYWIRANKIHWAPRWSREEIEANRESDRLRKDSFYLEHHVTQEPKIALPKKSPGLLSTLWKLISRGGN